MIKLLSLSETASGYYDRRGGVKIRQTYHSGTLYVHSLPLSRCPSLPPPAPVNTCRVLCSYCLYLLGHISCCAAGHCIAKVLSYHQICCCILLAQFHISYQNPAPVRCIHTLHRGSFCWLYCVQLCLLVMLLGLRFYLCIVWIQFLIFSSHCFNIISLWFQHTGIAVHSVWICPCIVFYPNLLSRW